MCGRYVSPEEAEIERFWHIGRHNNKPFGRRCTVSPTTHDARSEEAATKADVEGPAGQVPLSGPRRRLV